MDHIWKENLKKFPGIIFKLKYKIEGISLIPYGPPKISNTFPAQI